MSTAFKMWKLCILAPNLQATGTYWGCCLTEATTMVTNQQPFPSPSTAFLMCRTGPTPWGTPRTNLFLHSFPGNSWGTRHVARSWSAGQGGGGCAGGPGGAFLPAVCSTSWVCLAHMCSWGSLKVQPWISGFSWFRQGKREPVARCDRMLCLLCSLCRIL